MAKGCEGRDQGAQGACKSTHAAISSSGKPRRRRAPTGDGGECHIGAQRGQAQHDGGQAHGDDRVDGGARLAVHLRDEMRNRWQARLGYQLLCRIAGACLRQRCGARTSFHQRQPKMPLSRAKA